MKNLQRIVCENSDGTKSEYIAENLSISGEEKKVEPNHKFDWCVKQSFIDESPFITGHKIENNNCFGFYISKNNTTYDRYFSKDMKLEDMLSERVQKRYNPEESNKKTSGNEFSSGKFYSVASSSRPAVSSFTEISDEKLDYVNSIKINENNSKISEIEFEHDTPVTGIPKGSRCPQMDVFIKTENQAIFVEVKNHEILDSHRKVELSSSYADTKAFKIFGLNKSQLESRLVEKANSETGKTEQHNFLALKNRKDELLLASDFGCKWKGRHTHFDFKQFLCHFMGIISYAETHPEEEIYFYYLIYRNKLYEEEFDSKLYTELEAEVKEIFRIFTDKLQNAGLSRIHLGLCYNDKYNTISELKNIFLANCN